jgi:hypothetical protein
VALVRGWGIWSESIQRSGRGYPRRIMLQGKRGRERYQVPVWRGGRRNWRCQVVGEVQASSTFQGGFDLDDGRRKEVDNRKKTIEAAATSLSGHDPWSYVGRLGGFGCGRVSSVRALSCVRACMSCLPACLPACGCTCISSCSCGGRRTGYFSRY